MVWSCEACTFENSTDSATKCEICETPRSALPSSPSVISLVEDDVDDASKQQEQQSSNHKKRKSATTKTTQMTLFGSVASSANRKKSKTSSSNSSRSSISSISSSGGAERKTNTTTVKRSSSSGNGSSSSHCNSTTKQSHRFVRSNDSFAVRWKDAMALKGTVFGIEKLRKQQPAAVECALKSTSQIVVMATGGGKSLCYQLPAVVLGGTTVVVSPLIALMVDQVQALKNKGISAELVSSASGERHNNQVLQRLLLRQTKQQQQQQIQWKKDDDSSMKPIALVYCTPESITTERFRAVLGEMHRSNRLALFAIDEAHCLSTWGHDFRPAYRKLDYLRTAFPAVPCMACTATATPKVIDDIRAILQLEGAPCHVGSFDRPNICYKVRYKDSLDSRNNMSGGGGGAIEDLIRFVNKQHQRCDSENKKCSGIVYVHKREDTLTIARKINESNQKNNANNSIPIKAAAYHGGLKDTERKQVQEQWTNGQIHLAIATVAFGMGIDLPHVRYVIHWAMPKTVEGFYQESGRAGRDGLPAFSVLYYSKSDANKFGYLIQQRENNKKNKDDKSSSRATAIAMDALEKMIAYCTSPACRRQYILKHFGETKADPETVCKKTCDYCINPKKVTQAIQASECVLTQQFYSSSSHKNKWDGQWDRPHGDDGNDDDFADSEFDNSGRNFGDLDITGDSMDTSLLFQGDDGTKRQQSLMTTTTATSGGFVKASSILNKYDVLEVREKKGNDDYKNISGNNNSGFVRFRPKFNSNSDSGLRVHDDDNDNAINSNTVTSKSTKCKIPEHIRLAMVAAATKTTKKNAKSKTEKEEAKSSEEIGKEADRLRAELAKINAEREARMKSLSKEKREKITTGSQQQPKASSSSSSSSLAGGSSSSSGNSRKTHGCDDKSSTRVPPPSSSVPPVKKNKKSFSLSAISSALAKGGRHTGSSGKPQIPPPLPPPPAYRKRSSLVLPPPPPPPVSLSRKKKSVKRKRVTFEKKHRHY